MIYKLWYVLYIFAIIPYFESHVEHNLTQDVIVSLGGVGGGGGDWKCLIGLINTYVKHNLIQHVIVSLFYMSFLFPVSVLGFAGQSVYMVLLGSSD